MNAQGAVRNHDQIKGVRTRAYTLIEILVVISVLGIAFGLATMSMGSLRSTSMSTETRKFADFVNLCRSQAIARHTVIRVGIVVDSSNVDDEYRRYSAWTWNKRSKAFEQSHAWRRLPGELSFEPRFPDYLQNSEHAKRDVSSIRGNYLLGSESDEFPSEDSEMMRFLEFLPSGRARLSSGDLRNLIVVMRPGDPGLSYRGANWAQFNIDSLTGRVRIYRP